MDPSLASELRKGRVLVVAALGQALDGLLAEDVDAAADPVRQLGSLAESGDDIFLAQVDDPSRTVDVRYTVQPGARFPWHSHYGPVIVNIISGSLTYIAAGTCDEETYAPGQAFVDSGHGHVHSAYNPGTEPTVFIATFFEAPDTGALLIPADPGC